MIIEKHGTKADPEQIKLGLRERLQVEFTVESERIIDERLSVFDGGSSGISEERVNELISEQLKSFAND